MTDQSIESLIDLNNKLSTATAELEAWDKKLSHWLGESHADMHILLSWMERAQGNIPREFREFVKEARERLTLRQNAFLHEFGNMNESGEN